MSDTTLAARLDAAISALCPILGVSIGDPANRATWSFQPTPGATAGQIASGHTVLAGFDATPMVPRTPFSIASSIAALSAGQWANIVADLFAGVPAKWQLDAGVNSFAMAAGAIPLIQSNGAIVFGNKFQQVTMAAIYVVDNPNYLVHPSFDSTINVPGLQAAS